MAVPEERQQVVTKSCPFCFGPGGKPGTLFLYGDRYLNTAEYYKCTNTDKDCSVGEILFYLYNMNRDQRP
ncbi:MAG: hypothetical protein ACOY9Y_15645 [Bacillota bacterium]